MIKSLAIAFTAVLAVSGCKKKEEAKPAETAPTAEAKPAETKPTETPTMAANGSAEAGSAAAGSAAATGLASIPLANAKTADPNVLTGGQPTEDQLVLAKDKGVKTVVNLRSPGEEKDYAFEPKKLEELGIKYVNIPINGKTGDGLNEENAKKLAEALKTGEPTIVHCASGQRVGALYAMKAFYVDGKTPDEALEVGHQNGLSMPELEKIVKDKLATAKKPG
jgi:protein tyrosine phosphatase (PTP) superfamily phosphohydrolase (DUF442 family)